MSYIDPRLKAEDPEAAIATLAELGVRHVLGPVQGREDAEAPDPETGEPVVIPGAGDPAYHYFAIRTKDPGLARRAQGAGLHHDDAGYRPRALRRLGLRSAQNSFQGSLNR